jgi:hypothetical protein
MPADPTITDPGLYRVILENDRVRVLEYRDRPGDRTSPHGHPDSVMVTLSAFSRSIFVELKEPSPAGPPAGGAPLGPGT